MTECNQDRFEFASAHGRREIVAEFSGGTVSSDGGVLLLQEADSKMNLLARFSQCFIDRRNPVLIEHSIEQMIRQRVYALALGCEDLNDHEQLRQDPLLSALAGKAQPGTEPLAGESPLNRMELGTGIASRYKKITFWRDSVDELLVNVFLDAIQWLPSRSFWTSTPRTWRCTAIRKGSFITATTNTTAICRCTFSAAIMCCARDCGPAASGPQWEAGRKSSASSNRSARTGRK